MAFNWGPVIQELIKLSPFGGFALLSLISVSYYSNKNLDKAERIFEKSLQEIRTAYKDSAEDSRKLIEIFSEKLGGGTKK